MSTALQVIQPNLDEILVKIRKAKDASGFTNQSLADLSGVPYNTVCTITAGTVKQIPLAYAAALCKVLGLSLDELSGLRSNSADNEARIHQLEIENAQIKERITHFKRLRRFYRLLLLEFIGLCTILLCTTIGYMIFDIQLKNIGFFQSSKLTLLAILLSLVVIASVALIIYAMCVVVRDAKTVKGD